MIIFTYYTFGGFDNDKKNIFNTQEEKNLNLSFKRNAEEEYKDLYEHFTNVYEKSCEYEFLNNIISFKFSEYADFGGAYGSTSFTSLNIIITSDNIRQIQMNDLFKQDVNYKTVLSNLIVADLKDHGKPCDEISSDCGINCDNCDIGDHINSFYFSSNGLNLGFTGSCHVAGPYQMIIPYEKLRPLLRQEYINILLNQ